MLGLGVGVGAGLGGGEGAQGGGELAVEVPLVPHEQVGGVHVGQRGAAAAQALGLLEQAPEGRLGHGAGREGAELELELVAQRAVGV